ATAAATHAGASIHFPGHRARPVHPSLSERGAEEANTSARSGEITASMTTDVGDEAAALVPRAASPTATTTPATAPGRFCPLHGYSLSSLVCGAIPSAPHPLMGRFIRTSRFPAKAEVWATRGGLARGQDKVEMAWESAPLAPNRPS